MKLENIGAIRSATLPDNWQERKSGASLGVRWEKIYEPSNQPGKVEINFSYRGVPLDEASRKVFSFMLKQGEKNLLSEEEVMALRTVLGVATTGDNQYTNKHAPDSIDGPAFALASIAIRPVAQKMVLRVDGKFKNGRSYCGIFYPAGSEGRIVEELFLQVASTDDFDQYRQTFEDVVNSLVFK